MKIALIQPNSMTSRGILTIPLALLFIGEMARRHGHQVKIIDRNIDYFTKKNIKEFKPDVVGISVFTGPLIRDAVSISKFIREELGDKTKIVWGGIHPSLLPKETVANKFVDIVVIGEGEKTFVQLLDALESQKPLKNVAGICYKKDNQIIITEEREFIDLDEAPLVNWNLIEAKKYLDLEIVMVTSRGCPYNCHFCYNHEFNRRKWRAQSAERVLEEVRRIETITSNRHLKFHDDNFTVDKQRVIKILNGLSESYSLYIETRPEYIDKDFLDPLKKFKKVWLFIGVESGSQALLKSMNKMINIDTIRKAFKLIRPYRNIFTTASVILGLPEESYIQNLQTIAFARSLQPTWITYCLFTPYPGTYYYNDLVKKKLLRVPPATLAWADYTPDIAKSNFKTANFLKLHSRELKKINFESWIKVFFNTIFKGDFNKVYRFFKDKTMRFPLKLLSLLGMD